MARYYVSLIGPDSVNVDTADVNCDNKVDIIDGLLIARFYVGLVSQFC
ncbi:MAG: hypothetical protein JW881_18670 [Spirochaetales bacterium]|nr:hypothetical protein [Spirochaetales bacterium]